MSLSAAERSRRYRLKHPDRLKASQAAWAKRNPDKLRAKMLRRRKAHPEKFRLTPEKKAAKARRYAEKHPDHLRAYHRKYYEMNKARLQQQHRKYWQTSRKFIVKKISTQRKEWVAALKNHPCMDCGHIFPPCAMDFDHVNGGKVRNVAQMLSAPKDTVLAEIAKCELVCANCHRVRTFNRRRANVESIAS